MHADLVSYLGAIDDRLLGYLDGGAQLDPDVVKRLSRYTSALVEGSTTTELVVEDWPDFYDLASAFVVAYGTTELEGLYDQATFVGALSEGRCVPLTDADRVFLVTLSEELERYRG